MEQLKFVADSNGFDLMEDFKPPTLQHNFVQDTETKVDSFPFKFDCFDNDMLTLRYYHGQPMRQKQEKFFGTTMVNMLLCVFTVA